MDETQSAQDHLGRVTAALADKGVKPEKVLELKKGLENTRKNLEEAVEEYNKIVEKLKNELPRGGIGDGELEVRMPDEFTITDTDFAAYEHLVNAK